MHGDLVISVGTLWVAVPRRPPLHERHKRLYVLEGLPVATKTLHDLENQAERVLVPAGALGDIGAQTDAGEDRLARRRVYYEFPDSGRTVTLVST